MWRVLNCPSLGREYSRITREITRPCQFVRSSPSAIGSITQGSCLLQSHLQPADPSAAVRCLRTAPTQRPSFAGRAFTAVAVTAAAVGIYSYAYPQPVALPDRSASQGPHHDPLVDVVESSLQEDTHAITAHAEQLDSMTAAAAAQDQATPHTSSSGGAGPWITDDALAGAMQRRAISENRLRGYLHIKQREVQTWLDQAQMMGRVTREDFEKQMIAVEDEVNLKTNQIMYGVNDPHARKNYLAAYGCSKWSEEALRVVRSYSPLLELGAGLGHWQRELQARGADILAVDDYSALPVPDVRIIKPEFAGKVLKGDESEVVKHPRRTLLLVYPGPDDMAANALKLYKGNTLLYVGESRGGVNANDAFFDALAQDWECDKTVPVEPFPEGYEKLWVLRRKQKARRGWLW